MTTDSQIPLQDGKPISKLVINKDHPELSEPWGYPLPEGATYGNKKPQNLLQVSTKPDHKIYYEEYGAPDGEPVFVLHGGPGGGCQVDYLKYFDLNRYRVILFDQRGNGLSEPTVASGSPDALLENDTPHLISDLDKLRDHLGVNGKMHLFGGSWGSTYALAYAIEHPENVMSLQLRGIFLGRKNVFDYFYQGNAADYVEASDGVRAPLDGLNAIRDAHNKALGALKKAQKNGDANAIAEAEKNLAAHPPLSEEQKAALVVAQTNLFEAMKDQPQETEGAYRAYLGDPEHPGNGQLPADVRTPTMARAYAELWDDFVRVIPRDERHDMVAAYSRIFEMTPETDEDRALQIRAAKAWARWEGLTSYLIQDPQDLGKFDDDEFAINFARIENRYFMHGCYLGMRLDQTPQQFMQEQIKAGKDPRDNNWIMENIDRLKDIPTFITHPSTDQVTLPGDAKELFEGLKAISTKFAELGDKVLKLFEPICGHSMLERANAMILTLITQMAPWMTERDLLGPYGWAKAPESTATQDTPFNWVDIGPSAERKPVYERLHPPMTMDVLGM